MPGLICRAISGRRHGLTLHAERQYPGCHREDCVCSVSRSGIDPQSSQSKIPANTTELRIDDRHFCPWRARPNSDGRDSRAPRAFYDPSESAGKTHSRHHNK